MPSFSMILHSPLKDVSQAGPVTDFWEDPGAQASSFGATYVCRGHTV